MNETQFTDFTDSQANGLPASEKSDLAKKNDFVPPHHIIERYAYFRFLDEGTGQHDQLGHWLAAEKQVVAEYGRIQMHERHN